MSKQSLPVTKVAPRLPQDPHERRMLIAGSVSIALNILFLFGGAALAARQDIPDTNPTLELTIQAGTTTMKKAMTPPPSKKPTPQMAKIKHQPVIHRTPPPTLPKEIRDVPTPKQPEIKPVVTKTVETTPEKITPEEIKPKLTPTEETQPEDPNKGSMVEEKERFVAAASATATPLAGSPGSGEGMVGTGTPGSSPRLRGAEGSTGNPGGGGLTATVKGTGSGMVNIAPDAGMTRGPIGMPGTAIGPRNKILVATDQAIIPAENQGGFTVEQGQRVKSGTVLRNGQGSADGVLGNPGGTSRARIKGEGNGTGDGIPGLGGNGIHSTRGPISGNGEGGPIGPKAGIGNLGGGGGGNKLGGNGNGTGDGNGTGPGTGNGDGPGNGGNHPGTGGLLGSSGTGGPDKGPGGNGDDTGTAQKVKGDPDGKGLANTTVGVPDGKLDGVKVNVRQGNKVDVAPGNRIEEQIKANGSKAAGKTSAAIVKRRVEPQLSEEDRTNEFKKSISASFRINADGTFSVSAGSTGNSQVDAAVRKALNQWSFEPAWDNGKRVASTLNVTVNISVR